jgi:hypothetical protein
MRCVVSWQENVCKGAIRKATTDKWPGPRIFLLWLATLFEVFLNESSNQCHGRNLVRIVRPVVKWHRD